MQIRDFAFATSLAFGIACTGLAACGDDAKKADATSDAADAADLTDATETSPDATETKPEEVDEDVADTNDVETVTPVAADAVFNFRAAPGQAISEGPFPSDGLLAADGKIDLAPLGGDARFGSLAKSPILTRTDGEISARKGFGYISSVFFPMNVEPDLTTFAGAVHYVALSGPEEGKVFDGTASWFSYANYLAVFPAWGEYLVPGTKYAVIIDVNVKDKDGRTILAPPTFTQMIQAEVGDPTPEVAASRAAFADLRAYLALRDAAAVIGTVFTTEATLPFVNDLFAAVDKFDLVTPTANVRHDANGWQAANPVAGADLDAYFGVPTAPFEFMPTPWYGGSRTDAAKLPGGTTYTGGSFRGDIGYVVNGTLVAPAFNLTGSADGKVTAAAISYENGKPVATTRAAVPFTVYLCQSHLTDGAPDPDKTVPFAIFTHGGTALRSDALPFAVANCAAGYATISMDLAFHGGRQDVAYIPNEDLVVPTRVDAESAYTGKKVGDAGFMADYIGDNGGATTTVGGLFGLASDFDPHIIEANQISIATDGYTLVRYLRDAGPKGLGAFLRTKIDADHLVMESLSFGTSFTSALMAASDDFVGAVQSVGSGGIISLNLPMAPNNATLAGGIIRTIYGLKSTLAEINSGAQNDPMIMMLQWLSQRGDPAGYAPFVLRYRQDNHPLHVFGSGDSWDETLFSPAQISFNNAWGVPVFTAGADWTLNSDIPGASSVLATPFLDSEQGNLTFAGRTQTAGFFYNANACHAQVVTPICDSGFQPPYPPATPRTTPLISLSPICALQAPAITFLLDIAADQTPRLRAPGGSCADLYAP